MARQLTKKQEEFARQVVLSGNASEAYRRIYRPRRASAKTVTEAACRLLKDGKVSAMVHALRRRATDVADQAFDMSVERITRGLAEIGFADPLEVFSDGNRLKDVSEMPPHVRRTIASIEVLEEYAGHGKGRKLIGYTKKIKFWDKKGALDSLAKWRGMFRDQVSDDDDRDGATTVTIRLSRADRLLVEAIAGEALGAVSVAGPTRSLLPAPIHA